MDTENEKLILDGNAFYEIDLACIQKKQTEQPTSKSEQREAGRDLLPSLKKTSSMYRKGGCL